MEGGVLGFCSLAVGAFTLLGPKSRQWASLGVALALSWEEGHSG